MKLSKLAQNGWFVGISLMISGPISNVLAEQSPQLQQVVAAGLQINQSAQQSQQQVDQFSAQIQTKLQQFKAVTKETDGLKIYNQQMQTQLDHQLLELAQLAESIDQVSVIERQISPLMARMIDTLADFVALDVPFLPQERSQRIAELSAMLTRADVAVSEKFRRVLEAYQVEVDYGHTIEAYSGLLSVDGTERDVDFLRIGRIALIYQTRDGSHLGRWDQTSNSWQVLPERFRIDINKGLRIARKQLAPDLMFVPVSMSQTASAESKVKEHM